jgi:uncharacterized protein YegL
MEDFSNVEFEDNPDPRCPCILLLDTSSSMADDPIEALNEGLQAFQVDIKKDDLARKRVEVAIITFGNNGVQLMQSFVTVDRFEAPMLTAGGNTPMGTAIEQAINILQERKLLYQENGIPYYRPWIFMITDGAPTDAWQRAAQHIRTEEQAKALAFFAVGVNNADMDLLAQISVRKPLRLQGLKFTDMFLWLSRSQQRVSSSKVGELTALPPPSGWAEV